MILHRWPYCTGVRIVQLVILHSQPDCTAGHVVQAAILHSWPYCPDQIACACECALMSKHKILDSCAGRFPSSSVHKVASARVQWRRDTAPCGAVLVTVCRTPMWRGSSCTNLVKAQPISLTLTLNLTLTSSKPSPSRTRRTRAGAESA